MALLLYAVGVTLIGLSIPVEGLHGVSLALGGMAAVWSGYLASRRGGTS